MWDENRSMGGRVGEEETKGEKGGRGEGGAG